MSVSAVKSENRIGVVGVNSTGFVRTMLENLSEGRVSVVLRGRDDAERMQVAEAHGVVEPEDEKGWLRCPFVSRGGDELAQISFTSGTEGAPKAVLLSRANLHDVVVRLAAAMALTNEAREYVGVPVYHSFGYGRCRVVLNAGGEVYLPAQGFSLAEIRQMARAGEINAISAVPTQWRLFLENLEMFGEELASIRWVEIGSQFMSAEEKLKLRMALPNACILQHYGLTEASRSSLLRIDKAAPENLGSVGCAEGDVEIRINDRGRIEIRGPHVAMGIIENGAERRIERGAWFETSDLGRIDDRHLFFEGRADSIINIGGVKLSPDLLESQVRMMVDDHQGFAIVRRSDPLRGEAIGAALTPASRSKAATIVAAIEDAATSMGAAAAGSVKVIEVDELPYTDNGKVRRKSLEERFEADDLRQSRAPAASGAEAFRALCQTFVRGGDLPPNATFQQLEADSLAHVQAMLIIERSLGETPIGWELMALDDIEARLKEAAAEDGAGAKGSGGAPALPDGSWNMNPDDISFWALVREDFHTNGKSLSHQGFLMLFIHRFGNWRMSIKPKLLRAPFSLLYAFLDKCAQILFGMKLSYTVKVGRRVRLDHFGGMILGAREIGNDVFIRQNTTFGIRSPQDLNAKPVIGNYVDIGAGAVIVGNIRIGDNCVIGANSVVYESLPENSSAIGVPAKVIGKNPHQNLSPLPGWPPAPNNTK